LEWSRVNHFLTKRFFVNVGKDQFYPAFSGFIAHFRVNLGPGAFFDGADYAVTNDRIKIIITSPFKSIRV
jgi:hypothetical protein